jgi:hypothetical protein
MSLFSQSSDPFFPWSDALFDRVVFLILLQPKYYELCSLTEKCSDEQKSRLNTARNNNLSTSNNDNNNNNNNLNLNLFYNPIINQLLKHFNDGCINRFVMHFELLYTFGIVYFPLMTNIICNHFTLKTYEWGKQPNDGFW